MSQYDYKPEYRRNLPHVQPPGAKLFVTIRLAGSLPVALLQQMREEAEAREKQIRLATEGKIQADLLYEEQKRQFGRWDAALDQAANGPFWLGQPEIANIVAGSLLYRDGKVYDLDVFSLLSNHGHIVFTPLEKEDGGYHALQAIMHSLKLYTAIESNKILGREGQFWHHESYDHVIRDRQEWERVVQYVLNNPVKAGLAESWEQWPWTYLKP